MRTRWNAHNDCSTLGGGEDPRGYSSEKDDRFAASISRTRSSKVATIRGRAVVNHRDPPPAWSGQPSWAYISFRRTQTFRRPSAGSCWSSTMPKGSEQSSCRTETDLTRQIQHARQDRSDQWERIQGHNEVGERRVPVEVLVNRVAMFPDHLCLRPHRDTTRAGISLYRSARP